MRLTFLAHQVQRTWEWPALLNFILGGAGAGIFILSSMTYGHTAPSGSRSVLILVREIIPLLLIWTGLSLLAFEAGRPQRAVYLLKNISTSWLSRELLAAIVLAISLASYWVTEMWFFYVFSLGTVIFFIICQCMIIYKSCAIETWNIFMAPVVFFFSGLVSGGGFLLLFGHIVLTDYFLFALIVILVASLLSCLLFLYIVKDNNSVGIKEKKNMGIKFISIIFVWHIFPIFFLLFVISILDSNLFVDFILKCSGIMMVFAGVKQKHFMMKKIGFERSIYIVQ